MSFCTRFVLGQKGLVWVSVGLKTFFKKIRCPRCKKQPFNLGSFRNGQKTRRLRFQTREKFAGICFFFITFCPFILKTSHRVALISSHLYLLRAYSRLPLGWRYRWQHHVSGFTISPLKRKVVGRMSCLRRALKPYHSHAHSRWTVRLWRLDVIWTVSARSVERTFFIIKPTSHGCVFSAAEAAHNNCCPPSSGRSKVGLHGH